jgi:hypothetical protein
MQFVDDRLSDTGAGHERSLSAEVGYLARTLLDEAVRLGKRKRGPCTKTHARGVARLLEKGKENSDRGNRHNDPDHDPQATSEKGDVVAKPHLLSTALDFAGRGKETDMTTLG